MKTAVVTAVRGRTAHLRNQLAGLHRSTVRAGAHVVVAIDDDAVQRTVPADDATTRVIPFHAQGRRIPMAAARNRGAQVALDDGADLLIFLDVDCIPAPEMVDGYVRAAAHRDHSDALLCGPVTYLPPSGPAGYDLEKLVNLTAPHPARPNPTGSDVLVSTDYELFWSLSFAVRAPVWERIGGFCEEYTGYGGEDTDYGQAAAARGITMRWVGGAHAYHQHHPVSDPPVEHLQDIVDNAVVFHRRWGWWPMSGWLEAFRARGLLEFENDGRPRIL